MGQTNNFHQGGLGNTNKALSLHSRGSILFDVVSSISMGTQPSVFLSYRTRLGWKN